MNRLRIALGVLFALGWVGLARAQTAGSAPPPPPPGRVESPPLEGPATDLKPITEDRTERDAGRATEAELPAASHDALQTNQTPRPGDRVQCSQAAAGADRRASLGHAAPTASRLGTRLLGLGPRAGGVCLDGRRLAGSACRHDLGREPLDA